MATTGNLAERLDELLRSTLDRGQLLHALEPLTAEPGFANLAATWAPALVQRDAAFFGYFLTRHLQPTRHPQQAATARSLLPALEGARLDRLFTHLYGQVMTERDWNAELWARATSSDPEPVVFAAIDRRIVPATGWALAPTTALALYRRHPTLAQPILRAHVRHHWRASDDRYQELLKTIRAAGDDELFWALFRELADEDALNAAIGQLLDQPPPSAQIVAELRRREATRTWKIKPELVTRLVRHYALAVVPYFLEGSRWLDERTTDRLIEAVKELDQPAVAWRLFFRFRAPYQHTASWHAALRDLLARGLDEAALLQLLPHLTPPGQTWWWQGWQLSDELAVAFYDRYGPAVRPFLERTVVEPGLGLFASAEARGDEELLNLLSFRLLRQASLLAQPWRARRADDQAQLAAITGAVLGRFERLLADEPARYVQHAAAILSQAVAFEVRSWSHEVGHNPLFAYLAQRHHAVWLTQPAALRELLESPSIHVQLIALTMLAGGGPVAAQRVTENLDLLRALLLGRAHLSTKRLVLHCCEQALAATPALAPRLEALLAELVDQRGRRSIGERAMISLVRWRRQRSATSPSPAQPVSDGGQP